MAQTMIRTEKPGGAMSSDIFQRVSQSTHGHPPPTCHLFTPGPPDTDPEYAAYQLNQKKIRGRLFGGRLSAFRDRR
jgi:hypothetical protein